jgi:hypothetical protein
VHGLVFRVPWRGRRLRVDAGPRHAPGAGRFFLLHRDGLHIFAEVSSHGR